MFSVLVVPGQQPTCEPLLHGSSKRGVHTPSAHTSKLPKITPSSMALFMVMVYVEREVCKWHLHRGQGLFVAHLHAISAFGDLSSFCLHLYVPDVVKRFVCFFCAFVQHTYIHIRLGKGQMKSTPLFCPHPLGKKLLLSSVRIYYWDSTPG